MKDLYPVMLRLDGKKVVVVGGGKVAERKVRGLLETGAAIYLISPDITEDLKQLADSGKIVWLQRGFSETDLKDAFMIFAATNNIEVNKKVKNAAAEHQLVTIADDPESSDFHVPSQFKQGRLTIAISTGGASPVLAARIRSELQKQFNASYAEFLEFLYSTRQFILQEVADAALKKELLNAIVSEDLLNSPDREKDFHNLYERLKAKT